MTTEEIYNQVNRRYGSIVKSRSGQYEQTVAKAFGYTDEELSGVPQGANLGLSCGNPVALARLREGETVVDVGSGAGFDVFTAAKRVGPTGQAIGVDMNKNMMDKANANKARAGAANVQFVESAITCVALADNLADCIVSNCVINLVPAEDKQRAFDEMFRILKPGGRVAISDILARKQFTDDIKNNIALHVGCMAGASQVSEYEAFLKNAGFHGKYSRLVESWRRGGEAKRRIVDCGALDAVIVDSKHDLNVYYTAHEAGPWHRGTDAAQEEQMAPSCCRPEAQGSCCKPGERDACCEQKSASCGCQSESSSMAMQVETLRSQSGIADFNEWAGSFQVYAVKPAAD